jgi:hypothetical protein
MPMQTMTVGVMSRSNEDVKSSLLSKDKSRHKAVLFRNKVSAAGMTGVTGPIAETHHRREGVGHTYTSFREIRRITH